MDSEVFIFISKSSSDIDQLRRSSIISSMSAQSAQSCDAFTEKENRKRKLEGSNLFRVEPSTIKFMKPSIVIEKCATGLKPLGL